MSSIIPFISDTLLSMYKYNASFTLYVYTISLSPHSCGFFIIFINASSLFFMLSIFEMSDDKAFSQSFLSPRVISRESYVVSKYSSSYILSFIKFIITLLHLISKSFNLLLRSSLSSKSCLFNSLSTFSSMLSYHLCIFKYQMSMSAQSPHYSSLFRYLSSFKRSPISLTYCSFEIVSLNPFTVKLLQLPS